MAALGHAVLAVDRDTAALAAARNCAATSSKGYSMERIERILAACRAREKRRRMVSKRKVGFNLL
jgi:hypothetical protein